MRRANYNNRDMFPKETEPVCPEVNPILELHRHDGRITFHRKNGRWENLYAVRSEYLRDVFPEMLADLESDSYYSINGYPQEDPRPKIPLYYGFRTNERARYLTSCYVDLDCKKLGLTPGRIIGELIDMEQKGELPPVSIYKLSGSGVWLYWILHDEHDSDKAAPATSENRTLHNRIEHAIITKLSSAGSDPAVNELARVTRVPGSVNTKTQQRVRYWFSADENGCRTKYTLKRLAELFGVTERVGWPAEVVKEIEGECVSAPPRSSQEFQPKPAFTKKKNVPPEVSARKRRGWNALNESRMNDFKELWSMRHHGFDEGTRHYAALVYAMLLKCSGGYDKRGALLELGKLAATCRPPLPLRDCQDAVSSAWKLKKVSDRTISTWLGITEAEAMDLERLPVGGLPDKDRPMPAAAAISARRAKITQIVTEMGRIPTVREMGMKLIDAGFRGNHQTVQKDYQELKLQSGRTQAARAETERAHADRQPSLLPPLHPSAE